MFDGALPTARFNRKSEFSAFQNLLGGEILIGKNLMRLA